eukprot:c19741_g1_i5.p1 GENE.c19741_g1_i5~~c19741_g1_i5.p1  ORF type:complete len:309 (-),score=45.60 c19741_g1_i5:322-1248(-)
MGLSFVPAKTSDPPAVDKEPRSKFSPFPHTLLRKRRIHGPWSETDKAGMICRLFKHSQIRTFRNNDPMTSMALAPNGHQLIGISRTNPRRAVIFSGPKFENEEYLALPERGTCVAVVKATNEVFGLCVGSECSERHSGKLLVIMNVMDVRVQLTIAYPEISVLCVQPAKNLDGQIIVGTNNAAAIYSFDGDVRLMRSFPMTRDVWSVCSLEVTNRQRDNSSLQSFTFLIFVSCLFLGSSVCVIDRLENTRRRLGAALATGDCGDAICEPRRKSSSPSFRSGQTICTRLHPSPIKSLLRSPTLQCCCTM